MSARMTCADCDDVLIEYAAGTIDPNDRERVERHLTSCPRCRQELAMLRAARAALADEYAAIPRDTRTDGGWARLAGALPPQTTPSGALPDARPMPQTGDVPLMKHQPPRTPRTPTSPGKRTDLRTVELDESLPAARGPHPEPPRARWHSPAIPAVVAALVVVALGAGLFATLAHRGNEPGSTEAANVVHGAALPPGIEVTGFAPTGADAGWGTGEVVTNHVSGWPEKSVVLRFTAGRWEQIGEALPSIALDGLDMVAPDEGWAWGRDDYDAGVYLHISGGSWQRVTVPGVNPNASPRFIRMRTADDGWLVAQNPKDSTGNTMPQSLLHYSGGAWRPVATPLLLLTDLAPAGSDEAWLVGADGQGMGIFHLVNSRSTLAMRAPRSETLSLLQVVSPRDVWAMGLRSPADPNAAPNRDSWTPAIYHYDGASWQSVNVHAPAGVQRVQVLSADEMWATLSATIPIFSGQRFPTESRIQTLYRSHSGQWQAIALPYADLTSLVILPSAANAAGDIWALASYTMWTQVPNSSGTGFSGIAHAVLLKYSDGQWTEFGR